MTANRILAIGLDAGEPSLIEKLVKDGELPNISRLLEKGVYSRMRGSAEVASGSTWSSISCGVTPGKHGMGFCHRQIENGSYEIRKKRADQAGCKPFWVQLACDGKDIAVMDVPETMTENIRGIQVVGWGLDFEAWRTSSIPRELINEIQKKFGTHPLKNWYQNKPVTKIGWKNLAEDLITATRIRTAIWKEILRMKKYDFSLVVYTEPHFAGHLFWHVYDKNHPEYDPDLEIYLGDVIKEIYRLCDEAIGEFHSIDPEAVVSVFSNSGMGPNYSGRHFVAPVLTKLGYFAGDERRGQEFHILNPAGDVYAIERLEKLLGARTIMLLKKIIPESIWDTWSRKYLARGASWHKSFAFDLPSDNSGAIRINLKGREPMGLVAPDDYDRICSDITTAFMELTDDQTGEAIVDEVVRTAYKYRGSGSLDLPDLLIKWKNNLPVTKIRSEKVGCIERDHLPDKRTGAHKDTGFFLVSGESIQKRDGFGGEMYSWDVAPTLLHLMGESIPEVMDGRPFDGLLNKKSVGYELCH